MVPTYTWIHKVGQVGSTYVLCERPVPLQLFRSRYVDSFPPGLPQLAATLILVHLFMVGDAILGEFWGDGENSFK